MYGDLLKFLPVIKYQKQSFRVQAHRQLQHAKVKLLTYREKADDSLSGSVSLERDGTCWEGVVMWLMAAFSFTGTQRAAYQKWYVLIPQTQGQFN